MAPSEVGADHGTVYHLVQQGIWQECKETQQAYYPPTYEADGFIHLTKEPELLLEVANHFYKQVPGQWLVLAIDSTQLTSQIASCPNGTLSQVIFEAAAHVGNTAPSDKAAQQLFPHLYGTIDFAAVISELPVERDADGTFLAIPDLRQ